MRKQLMVLFIFGLTGCANDQVKFVKEKNCDSQTYLLFRDTKIAQQIDCDIKIEKVKVFKVAIKPKEGQIKEGSPIFCKLIVESKNGDLHTLDGFSGDFCELEKGDELERAYTTTKLVNGLILKGK